MSREAQVRASLYLKKGNLTYRSQPESFFATVTGTKGPCPGCIVVATTVTNVDFSQLVQPGLCRLMNLDPSNYVEWGIHDGSIFHPIGEILPGESYVIRLSRFVGEEEAATGTGTTGDVNAFCLRARGAACSVLVECFES